MRTITTALLSLPLLFTLACAELSPSEDMGMSSSANAMQPQCGPDKSAPPAPMPPPAAQQPPTAKGLRFGVAPQWSQTWDPPSQGPAHVDAVVVGDWLVENGFHAAHENKARAIIAKGKTPYFFGYILTAMTKKGLGDGADCDGDPNRKLCKEGAAWVRAHIDSDILPVYRDAARKIGQAVGGKEAILHLEPDYFQFSEKAQANAFTRDESNAIINKVLGVIREGCASCKVTIDFSPWFSPDKTKWATSAGDFYSAWDRSVVQYVGLTGKPFPFTEGKVDNFTYAEISSELRLPIVIIDAYTFGGGPIDIDRSWLDASAIAKAESMGVAWVFLSQQGDIGAFDSFLSGRRR